MRRCRFHFLIVTRNPKVNNTGSPDSVRKQGQIGDRPHPKAGRVQVDRGSGNDPS